MRSRPLLLTVGVIAVATSGCLHPWFKMGTGAPEDQEPVIATPDGTPPRYAPGTPPWVPLLDACMNQGGSRGECIESLPPETLAALEEWERANGEMRRTQLRFRQAQDGFGFTTDDNIALTQASEAAAEWTLGSVMIQDRALPGFSMAFLFGLQSGIETGFAWATPDAPAYAACFRGLSRDSLYRLFMTDAATSPDETVRDWMIRVGTLYCVELGE